MTSPASRSEPGCLAIACRVIGRLAARSVTVAAPPNAGGCSRRSMRRPALWPPSQDSGTRPPTRRSTVALWPNHVPNPSAVVIASHTFAGGWATLMLRSIRSGKPMTPLHLWQPSDCHDTLWQPDSCVKSVSASGPPRSPLTRLAPLIYQCFRQLGDDLDWLGGGPRCLAIL